MMKKVLSWIILACFVMCAVTGCTSEVAFIGEGQTCTLFGVSDLMAANGDYAFVVTVESVDTDRRWGLDGQYYFTVYTAKIECDVFDSYEGDTITFWSQGIAGEHENRIVAEHGGYFAAGDRAFVFLYSSERDAEIMGDERYRYHLPFATSFARIRNGMLDPEANRWNGNFLYEETSALYGCTTVDELIDRVLALHNGTLETFRTTDDYHRRSTDDHRDR